MPYYNSGDYYGQGDYYQGDGIFSAIGRGLKVAAGGLVGAVGGFIKGGPVGAAKGAITGVLTTAPGVIRQGITDETLAAGGSQSALTPELMAMHAAAVARGAPPMLMAPGGGGLMLAPGMGLMTMRGYRPNKSTYAVRGGGTSRWGAAGMLRLIAKGTVPVKNRRMNVANPRALRRGLRRAAGFVKLARRAHVRLAAFTSKGRRKKK